MKTRPSPSNNIPDRQAKSIQTMFSTIARRYDFLNRLLSFGVDALWRKKCIDTLLARLKSSGPLLDLAAGTGDLSIELEKKMNTKHPIVAADFSQEMLKILQKKRRKNSRITIVAADGLHLPFRQKIFSGAAIGFGIRNFTDRSRALKELFRVLKPGGALTILEFALPKNRIIRMGYLFYFEKILPLIGGIFSKRSAYTYLPESVKKFPHPETFAHQIASVGFINVTISPLTAGIATLYCAEKPLLVHLKEINGS